MAAVDRHLAHMGLCPAPVAPTAGPVAPTSHPAAISTDTVAPFLSLVSVAPPPPSVGTVAPYTYSTVAPVPVSTLPPPAASVVSTAHPAPAPTRTAPPPATSFAPVLNGPLPPPPPDERILYDDSSSLASNSSSFFGLRADFVASLQAAYRILDMRRVPRVQSLQSPPSADRTAVTQLLICSMRDSLSGIFDVADPTGTVTLTSRVWVPGWHAPLLKLNKAATTPNRDDTHDLHRLVDDMFSQLQKRMTSGSSGPAALKTLLADFADYFDHAPRGAALSTLQKFGVRTGTPFASYLRALRVVVASTVEKDGPLAPSAAMAIELVRISTAQQYPMLMPTLFPGDLGTREKPYVTLALIWAAFGDLKHNMSPASAPPASSLHAPSTVAVSTTSAAASQRHNSRPTRPSHTVSNVLYAHSRRDPFRVDYGLWPFDDKDYAVVCTVTNHMANTNLTLWTPLLTEDARRQACLQYSGRCCNCGSTDHSLRWCPATFTNIFSLLNPEFATHDTDGSMFETWKEKTRRWRRRGPNRRHQSNGKRNTSGSGNSPSHNRGPSSAPQCNSSGPTPVAHFAAAAPQPLAPSSAPGLAPAFTAAPIMRYGPAFSGNTNPNAHRPGTFQVPPTPTP